MISELAVSYDEESEQILELIYTDEDGTTFVRETSKWVEIDENQEHPTIYDLPLVFVDEEFTEIYDEQDDLYLADTTPYQVL